MNNNMEKGFLELIGHNTYLQIPQQFIKGKVLYVPLPLCFDKPVSALPLLALINTRLALVVSIKSLDQLTKYNYGIELKIKKKFKLEINASYVFLEQDIREKFARSRHEYLVETKKCYEYSVSDKENNINLDFENPCKEMSWFYMDQKIKDSKDYWNFTGLPKKIYNKNFLMETCFDQDDEIKQMLQKIFVNKEKIIGRKLIQTLNKFPIFALSESELKIVFTNIDNYMKRSNLIKDPNPFERTKLNFNGQNRFDMVGKQSGQIESTIFLNEQYIEGLNTKAFGRLTESSHMGSLNLSSAHDMQLDYVLNSDLLVNGTINIIINTYQIIRIASGFGTSLWK